MTATHTIWAGKEDDNPPSFNGLLIVLNIRESNRKEIPADFLATVSEEVNKAHAAGWMVMYLHDAEIGVEPQPLDFDENEENDFIRSMSFAGLKEANFHAVPAERDLQFSQMFMAIKEGNGRKLHWNLHGDRARITGMCKTEGEKAYLPPRNVWLPPSPSCTMKS